ncbi:MAG: triphosphoribosyl-dephospho-CoA synthase [Gammaproteobacteria bacterium]
MAICQEATGVTHLDLGPAIARIIGRCCRLDVEALKPGNVSVHSPGHGMRAEDFIESADAIAPILARPGLTVGARVLDCVEATLARVGCNTNLGIILLSAPLISAVFIETQAQELRQRLNVVLRGLDQNDARLAFEAIRLASPAGIGRVRRHDVGQNPTVSLLEAMRAAQAWDRIAYQYAHGFRDVFNTGVAELKRCLKRWDPYPNPLVWATVGCFLGFMATIPDTHIRRKFGPRTAERVRETAQIVETRFKACENPLAAVELLRHYDNELKREGLNPGTSADLTVASLIALHLEDLLIGKRCNGVAMHEHKGNISIG